eukprot:COSAG04_NODE_19822_length_407_cov_0.925325_1_plen_43_part_10
MERLAASGAPRASNSDHSLMQHMTPKQREQFHRERARQRAADG